MENLDLWGQFCPENPFIVVACRFIKINLEGTACTLKSARYIAGSASHEHAGTPDDDVHSTAEKSGGQNQIKSNDSSYRDSMMHDLLIRF